MEVRPEAGQLEDPLFSRGNETRRRKIIGKPLNDESSTSVRRF